MPAFDSTTQTKLAALRTLRTNGVDIEVHEMIKIEWPSPDGTIWYAVQQTDEVASTSPGVSPIQTRIIPGSSPNWFLPLVMNSEIGDETVDITFGDSDDAFTTLMNTHGEGIRCTFYFWFPSPTRYGTTIDLLLECWHGHLRYEKSVDVDRVTVTIAQGFRDADAQLPWRQHNRECSSPFPPAAGLTTQAQIDEIDCPYNNYNGIGSTGTSGFTTCPRLSPSDCTARGIDPLRHFSHFSMSTSIVNSQTHGPTLYSLSQGNESNLKDPVRVIMGRKRVSGMAVMMFRRDYDNNHPDQGWFFAAYEIGQGPIQSVTQAIINVGGNNAQNAVPMHFNFLLGNKGQPAWVGLSTHGFSGTAYFVYNYGWVNPATVYPADANGSAVIEGLTDIRIYTTSSSYTTGYTTNRVWQILHMMTNKRWGYGLDYARFNIDDWIAAAAWADVQVRYTDPNGTNWDHVRAASNVELTGRKVADQVNDMCLAGRLSRPFMFNGKICIAPLQAISSGDLTAAPIFVDDTGLVRGVSPNIIWENGKTSLRIGPRLSDLDLPNRIEATIDDEANNWQQTPAPAVEDLNAQYRAGRVTGDGSRKRNVKTVNLLGVTSRAQAVKVMTSVMDLGQFDEGGLQNNLPVTFKLWFIDALDLYPTKIINLASNKLTKYGFTYFRVKTIKRLDNLYYEITAQAYNATYMNAFETAHTVTIDTGGGICSVDSDCPPGYVCVNGVCQVADFCDILFDSVNYDGSVLTIATRPC